MGPALHHTCRVLHSGRETDRNKHTVLKSSTCQALCSGDLSNVLSLIPPKVPGKLTRLSQVYRWGNNSSEMLKLAHSCSEGVPRTGLKCRFGWSHHTSLLLFYAVLSNAWTPCCPLTQAECPETMSSPPAAVRCEPAVSEPLPWGTASLPAACPLPCGNWAFLYSACWSSGCQHLPFVSHQAQNSPPSGDLLWIYMCKYLLYLIPQRIWLSL